MSLPFEKNTRGIPLFIIIVCGVSHSHNAVNVKSIIVAIKDEQRNPPEVPRLFCFIPSISATRAKIYPQNAAVDKQKKQPQDSNADDEIVPAPPKTRLTDVTRTSAKKRTPPELPINCPSKKKPITIVLKPNREKTDGGVSLEVEFESLRPVSIHCSDTLIPRPILQQKTVNKLSKKCGEQAEKLPRATNTPAIILLRDDSSETALGGPPFLTLAPKVITPNPSSLEKCERCSRKSFILQALI
mmetsp:Transcript_10909/g.16701  ORF Transcript_10909/g.16701 Transcript_10909/m.16701 type:complete len:243 (-) Transcript_10909:12-740(-)